MPVTDQEWSEIRFFKLTLPCKSTIEGLAEAWKEEFVQIKPWTTIDDMRPGQYVLIRERWFNVGRLHWVDTPFRREDIFRFAEGCIIAERKSEADEAMVVDSNHNLAQDSPG